jgi:hypothetical protein
MCARLSDHKMGSNLGLLLSCVTILEMAIFYKNIGVVMNTKTITKKSPRKKSSPRHSAGHSGRFHLVLAWAIVATLALMVLVWFDHRNFVVVFLLAAVRVLFEFRKNLFVAALESWVYLTKVLAHRK